MKGLFVVVLLFFWGTQLSFSEGRRLYIEDSEWDSLKCSCNEQPSSSSPRNFITWEDMEVEDSVIEHRNIRSSGGRVIVVAKDGTGDSVTVQGAVDLVPDHNTQRVKIYIRPGIYREKVVVPRSKPYVSFIGDPNNNTLITGHIKASDRYDNGREIGTFNSATVTVESDYFCATGMAFENTIVKEGGPGRQAVALRVSGDKSMFYRIKALGSQDTLLDEMGTHYFYQCYIQGSTDFIFGNAKSLYQDCTLHSNAKRSGAIAAHHRNSDKEDTGYSFVNCRVNGTGDVLLGRAWGKYSRAVFSYCDLGGIINSQGWSDWGDSSRRTTVWFGEYQNRGEGADRRGRVPWSKSISYKEASPLLDRDYIDGRQWLRL